MVKVKKHLFCIILLFSALFALPFFLLSSKTSANGDNSANSNKSAVMQSPENKAVIYNKPVNYFYFNNPSAIFASDTDLTVADGGTLYKFSGENYTSLETSVTDVDAISKLVKYNSKYIILSDGIIRYADDPSSVLGGSYEDFCILGDSLFAVSGASVMRFNISETLNGAMGESLFSAAFPLKKIVAAEGKIYVTAKGEINPNTDDLYCYSFSEDVQWLMTARGEGFESISELALMPSVGGLAGLTRSGIGLFFVKGSSITEGKKYSDSGLKDLSVNSGGICMLTNANGITKADFNFNSVKLILGSASSDKDFYNAPAGIDTRKGLVAVADRLNNRVVINTSGSSTVLSSNLYRPTAVAIDSTGRIFVANNYNQISRYESDYSRSGVIYTAPDDSVNIVDLKFDSNNNLYVLSASGSIYKIKSNTATFDSIRLPAGVTNVSAINLALGSDKVYIAATTENGNAIFELTGTDLVPSPIAEYTEDLNDFCLDHNNSVYILTKDGDVVKYSNNIRQPFTVSGISGKSSQIVMNTADHSTESNIAENRNKAIKYGDLLISDAGSHTIKVIDGGLYEVNKGFNTNPDAPDVGADTPPSLSGNEKNILYKLLQNSEVYASEAEINVVNTLSANLRVIIIDFDASKKFNFVIADNLKDGKDSPAIVGYVYTASIDPKPLPYTSEHPETCHTWRANVPIYAYPSRNSPIYPNYNTIPQNTTLRLLDFAYTLENEKEIYGYSDNYVVNPITWFRVSFGTEAQNYVGYVTSDYISMRGENPDPTVYPRTNGVIISKDKGNPELGAIAYRKIDGGGFEVREDIVPITVGTRIEVVDSFDSSSPYTLIKYLTEFGTIEVYVDTLNIKYEGINVVQVVAIIIIILTLILAGLIVWRILYLKRSRRISEIKE